MTPNFALNLTEDGIVLLHRHSSGAGWVEIADAPLDSNDLGAALGALRDKAVALEGPDFTTKLILPPSQLLYATIQTDGDIKADVERALEERTPYTANQVKYDVSGSAPEVQVVAVARETLEEAESFLGPYGFNPVGFTALPNAEMFSGAPNLGPLPSIGGHGLADVSAVVILSPEDVATLGAEEADTALEEDNATAAEEDTTKVVEADEVVSDLSDIEEEVSEPTEPLSLPPEVPSPPSATPAAFSSRRKPSLGPANDPSGELVTARAPRIAIPTDELKKAPARKKPPRVEPRIKTGEAAKTKSPPAIVPPTTISSAPEKPAEPPVPKSSRLKKSIVSARAKVAKPKEKNEKPATASTPAISDPIAELAARQAAGKPHFLGLILTAVLVIALLAFGAWSSFFLPDNSVIESLDEQPQTSEIAQTNTPSQANSTVNDDNERLASFPEQEFEEQFTIPSEEEIAESETPEPEIEPFRQMTQTEAVTAYAVSGVWQLAPVLRPEVASQDLSNLYEASLDPNLAFEDAPALASFDPAEPSLDVLPLGAPPPVEILRNLDSRGLVRPSPEGTENPDGVLVFSGKPPVEPLQRPSGLATEEALDPEATEEQIVPSEADSRLAGIRPAERPSDLRELFERAAQGGLSRAELAKIRPTIRPESEQAKAREEAIARALQEADADAQEAEARAAAQAAAQAELDKPTAQAVARSQRPGSRPRNFARVVARAKQTPPEERNPSVATTSARATGPAVVRSSRASPTGTTRASVARAATDNNAIALGKVALVGVFGTSSNRRALVRMPNGRFKKVGVGDRVDGGRVAAIGEGQLKYTKGGRTVTLKMPKG